MSRHLAGIISLHRSFDGQLLSKTLSPSNKSPEGHANLAKLSLAKVTQELLARPLKLPTFPRSEIAPSLYCGSTFESDMYVYSASVIYNDLQSYSDTRYKIAM